LRISFDTKLFIAMTCAYALMQMKKIFKY